MKEYREQEKQRPNIRHRLVGALVLVALAAIMVPLVFDFDADELRLPTRDNIPEKPPGYHIEEVPLAAPSGAVPFTAGVGTDTPAEPAVPRTATGQPAVWVVQVGSFSSRENAVALRNQLRAKGYQGVFIERETVAGKPALRVRIGPELERNRSEQVRDRLSKEMNLAGEVVSYDGRGTRVE